MTLDIPLSMLRRFNRRFETVFAPPPHPLHRAFDRVIVAGAGSLLLVPLPLVSGDLREVVDGCPVPWEEVLALRDTPPDRSTQRVDPEKLARSWPGLALITPYGWTVDTITPFPAGSALAIRFMHASGVTYAEV